MPVTNSSQGVLPGNIDFFAANTPPAGWMKANGALISRTTYAALFLAIGTVYGVGDGSTTFGIPDLRGEFLRGWDDARGIDTGRAIGTAQTGENAPHTHAPGTLATATGGSHSHTAGLGTGTGGALNPSGGGSNSIATPTSTDPGHVHTLSGATGSSGVTESRPRNVAMLACIKF